MCVTGPGRGSPVNEPHDTLVLQTDRLSPRQRPSGRHADQEDSAPYHRLRRHRGGAVRAAAAGRRHGEDRRSCCRRPATCSSALAVVLEVCALLSYANLTRFILKVLDIRLRLVEVLSITLSSLAVSHVLSAGGVGGWVVTYNALRKRKVAARPDLRGHRRAAVLQLRRPLAASSRVALVYLVVERGESTGAYFAAIVLIGLLLWLTGVRRLSLQPPHQDAAPGGAARARSSTGSRGARWSQEDHIDGWLDNLFAGMRRMTTHHGAFRTHPRAAPAASGSSTCSASGRRSWPSTTASALSALVVSYVVAYSVGTLAPTPGGLGAVEGILIALFVSFGVPVGDRRRRRPRLSPHQLLAADPARPHRLRGGASRPVTGPRRHERSGRGTGGRPADAAGDPGRG